MAECLHEFDPDRFQDVRRVGAGNNATVFCAWDRDLERRVAIKISMQDTLLDMLGSEHLTELGIAEGLQQFVDEVAGEAGRRYTLLREARLLARIDDPRVVSVLDVGVLDGSVAVVMPYLTGGQLDDRVVDGPWPRTLALALEIGEGLAAIHAAGLLHRDFKPNNVLFDEQGRPRIADLGLACRVDDAEAMADWPGTAAYMAPETRARSFRDQRDDLYAYCVVVFRMFYGHEPFASKAERVAGRLSRIDRGVPPAIHRVLGRGLHPHADRRWPDMPTLLAALRQAAAPRPARRWPWLAAGAAAALAVALGVSSTRVWADACGDVDSELSAIWSGEVEAELRGALGTRAGGDALSAWAIRWLDMRARECELAEQGERAPTPSPCAEQLRVQFATTVTTLRRADHREGLDFAAVIAELPPPERCLDSGATTRVPTGLTELRQLDLEIRGLIAANEQAEGRGESARERIEHYTELARAKASRWDLARAQLWRGVLSRQRGELDDAHTQLELAYSQATALGAELLGAEAMLALLPVDGARGQLEALEAHALVARASFERLAPERVAEVHEAHGVGLLAGPLERQREGVELLTTALRLREQQQLRFGDSLDAVGRVSESLARGLLALGRHDDALAAAQRSLEIHEQDKAPSASRTRALLRLVFEAEVRSGRWQHAAEITYYRVVESTIVDANEETLATVESRRWMASMLAEEAARRRAATQQPSSTRD